MMRMDSLSLGDEVRFRTSPTVIEVGDSGGAVAAGSWSSEWGAVRQRLQAVINKNGMVEMDLSARRLHDVPAELYNMLRLEVLRLNNNQLHIIASAISRLHRLRILHLQHNKLSNLPATLCNCTHLHELDLSHNRLTALSQHLALLRYLKVLRLAHNQFESLPHQLCELKSLRVLDVSGNQLWHLPHTMQQLHNLTYINLANNRFEQLPISVCSLKNLTVLNLHGNKLHNLPPDFEQLSKLQELSLAANQLDTMPYSICQLKNLHTLDLSNNRLKSLPVRMSRMTKLKIVSAHTNQLVALPNHLEHVEYLNVTDNRLQNFSLANVKRLKHLAAGHNQLENVPLGVYNLSHLEILKLNNNQISYVSQDIELLKKLRTLDLGNNQLTSLPQVINELELLQTFNIRGNPIEAKPLRVAGHNRVKEAQAMNGWGGMRARDVFYPDGKQPGGYAAPMTNGYLPSQQSSTQGGAKATHFKKKTQKSQKQSKKSTFATKSKSTQHATSSKNTATQYTPKSSIKARERPPLDGRRATSVSTLFPPQTSLSNHHQHSPSPKTRPSTPKTIPPTPQKSLRSANGTLARSMADLSMNPPPVYSSNPLAHSEIAYPMHGLHATASMPNLFSSSSPNTPRPAHRHHHHNNRNHSPQQQQQQHQHHQQLHHNHHNNHHHHSHHQLDLDWELPVAGSSSHRGSDKSLAVTINETVGDRLSLGEEDYEFQPTTVTDHRLLGVCTHVEEMLNQQLMHPTTQQQQQQQLQLQPQPKPPKGIFRKRMNEFGTLRTLNGLARRPALFADNMATTTSGRHGKGGTVANHKPATTPSADTFRVTAAGGMYRASCDPNISVYFPMNAVPGPMTITIQVDKFSLESLKSIQQSVPLTENLLSVGDIVHIVQSEDYTFSQQVILTLPMPPSVGHKGKLHVLDYSHEDNSSSPCTGAYTVHQGYISVKTWHFSGKGAILTKSKCRYKACKSMDAFLQHLYL